MLDSFPIYVDLPASDLARARAWYEHVLGLTPITAFGAGFLYRSGGVPFYLYQTDAAGSARNTAATWLVDDLGATMAVLRGRGLEFQDYETPDGGPTTTDGVARSPDGAVAAWFQDSEGNTLGISQLPDHLRELGVRQGPTGGS